MILDDTYRLKELRKTIFLTAYSGNVGHLASAFSVIEILYALYFKGVLRYEAKKATWEDRDRLIVSKGHASLALYSILAEAGYFEREQLFTFCKPGSKLGGEPKLKDIPGVEASTGSLGHGLSFAVGVAMAKKMDKSTAQVYVILGDGECQEGSIWEGIIAARNFQLNNLTVILDSNKLQAMGSIEEIMSINEWENKFRAFEWQVDTIDGHDVQAITDCLLKKNESNFPRMVIANTTKGKGVSFMENVPIWHFRMPNEIELETVMEELDISKEELALCGMHI